MSGQSEKPFEFPRKKLSIYSQEDKPRELVEQPPNEIELALRAARHQVTGFFQTTRNQTKIVVDQWIAVEQQISSAARKVVAPQESTLLPHGFYVLVSAWAGSILAKNRGIVSRAFAPLALGTAATCYFYPKTTLNIIRSNPQGLELSNQVSSATSDLQEWIHDSRARLQTLASTDPSILASTMYQKIKDKINSANSSEKKD